MGSFVQSTLADVINFRQQIANNRQRFLVEKERELNNLMGDLQVQISSLETTRQKLYGLLQEEGAFDSIRNTYEQLIEEKVQLERNNSKLNQVQEIESSILDLKTRLATLTRDIIDNIRNSQNDINTLRLLYKEILESAIFVDKSTEGGYLDIEESSGSTSPVNVIVDVPKSESLGKYRFKMLAYSLTVFFNILFSNRNLPHFLIHDGVFHSIARKTTVNVLNYIHQRSLNLHNFQYIFTGNEDEILIPLAERDIYGHYEFDLNECIIATYESVPEKMIFKREF